MDKMKNKSMFLLWAGAAISIAEIYTGGFAAPLGIGKGILAVIIGHLIGGGLLALGGLISFSNKTNAMDTVKSSLGGNGVKIVAFLNVLQLLGWSAVMIIQGSRGINATLNIPYNVGLVAMTVLVFLWSFYFENKSKIINDGAVLILFILVALIFLKVDLKNILTLDPSSTSFMSVVEMSIAMPVSWLPLIGDYTKRGESKKGVFLASFFGYTLASCAMYILGLMITVFTGKDIVEFIASFSVPLVACIIIVLSTVTTTFLDVFSAVESSKQLFKIKNPNKVIALYSLIALGISFVLPIEDYESFLYIIGSVFVPVYSVVIMEYFLGNKQEKSKINVRGIVIALIGIILYNIFTKYSVLIPTVCVLVIIPTIYLFSNIIFTNKIKTEEV
jgi:putative hydroxymethylpyrimidine transporter CytX